MIHIKPIQGFDWIYADCVNFYIQDVLVRFAVPFFFVAAGFFLFRKISLHSLDVLRIKNYCRRIIILLGLWTILLFIGSNTQLWYLGGLVISVVLITLLLKKNQSFVRIGVWVVTLYIVGLLFDTYSGVISNLGHEIGLTAIDNVIAFMNDNISRIFRLGFTSAPLFFFMGVIFAYQPIRIKRWAAYLGLVASGLTLVTEASLLERYTKSVDHNMYLSLIPFTFCLFYIVATSKLKDKNIYRRLRAIGVLIFFMHIFFRDIVKIIIKTLHKVIGVDLSCLSLVIVIVLTTLSAVAIESMSHKEKYKWLQHLY